jgi:metal-dependent amidase/aminoacylase/carboxypeptidase family protein
MSPRLSTRGLVPAPTYSSSVYGGAMHGCTHDVGRAAAPGVAYHAVTDVRSSAAIQTFLAELFG